MAWKCIPNKCSVFVAGHNVLLQGSAATSPLPSPAAAAGAVGRPLPEPGSPPVRDMRELLGEKATSLHVGPKLSTDSTASSSRAASGAGTAPPAAK